ncbi:MAG: hypothetical protein MI724_02640 [Spirochaetales bacterium]|nr:hypothetical protein [Spirochaetales bacterium]
MGPQRIRMNYRALIRTAAAFLVFIAPGLAADDAEVVYLEGEPELRTVAGATEWLDFGTGLNVGDSVVTGLIDYVELEQGEGATIQVEADTVFTIREVEREGRRETVMTNSAGAVRYRFNRVIGRDEPLIGTASTVAGIRGTEVTVYAGADGSSLFLVESGEVEVTSAGESVSVTANRGVEVAPGEPPGETFEIIGRAVDFSSWNGQKSDDVLNDPVGALRRIETQLRTYYRQLDETRALYRDARALYDAKYEELVAAVDTHGQESTEADALREEITPLSNEATIHAFNTRYYALTALSLRRYVLGGIYVEMRSRFFLDAANPVYRDFITAYEEILAEYERRVTPDLVDVDI